MSNLEVTSAGASSKPRPWSVETLYEFQRPAVGVDELHSSSSAAATHRKREPMKLVIDLRVAEGRRLTEQDERELGPVSPDLLNEVRSRWPA